MVNLDLNRYGADTDVETHNKYEGLNWEAIFRALEDQKQTSEKIAEPFQWDTTENAGVYK
jgi:hypothetical protein